jgi:hypothetical protein
VSPRSRRPPEPAGAAVETSRPLPPPRGPFVKIPVRALLAAVGCLAIAWSWRFTGERQEVTSRRSFVQQLLDEGRINPADFAAQALEKDFVDDPAVARVHATTRTLAEANALLKQRRPADARARLDPVVAQADAPAVAHWLLGIALNQLGEKSAAAAEQAKARALAPDAPLFREPPHKEAAGRG